MGVSLNLHPKRNEAPCWWIVTIFRSLWKVHYLYPVNQSNASLVMTLPKTCIYAYQLRKFYYYYHYYYYYYVCPPNCIVKSKSENLKQTILIFFSFFFFFPFNLRGGDSKSHFLGESCMVLSSNHICNDNQYFFHFAINTKGKEKKILLWK